MAYLAVNRDGEELVFNDCPIYDRVEDTWKIPMLRWELVYDDPDDHSAGVHENEVRDDDYGVTLPNGTIERIIGGPLTFANEPIEIVTIKSVERCIRNTYGNDNNLERWIKVMVENELQNRDFNIVSRMVEKVLRDKMLDNIEIIVRNKDIND